MKTKTYENVNIENFEQWSSHIHKKHKEIFGTNYNKQTLKIFYEDNAQELTIEEIKNIQIPTILKFRKKITPPDLDIADTTVTAISENEFTVETQQPEEARKKVKEKYVEFEEINHV